MNPGHVLGRSLSRAAAFPGLAIGALLCLLTGSGLALLGPLVIRHVIDDGLSRGDASRIAALSLLFLSIETIRTAAEAVQGYLLRKLSHRITAALRLDVFRHVQRLPLSWFGDIPSGEVVNRSTGDVAALGDAIAAGLVGLFRDAFMLIAAAIVTMSLDLRFGLMTLGCSLLVGIPALFIRKAAQERSSEALRAASRTSAVLEESISGHAIIQLFGLAPSRETQFRLANENALGISLSTLRMRVWFDAGVSVSSAIALTLIIGVGGSDIEAGRMSVGMLVAFIQYGSVLLGALRGTAERGVGVFSGIAAARRVYGMLDTAAGVPAEPIAEVSRTTNEGLSFSDVVFGYRAGEPILRGVSARILPGERIALAGRTGAGKTTLMRLLARLYDPWEGALRMDGRALAGVPAEELRRDLVYMTQRVELFHASVLENIRLGDARFTRDDVLDVCREVGALEFIERLQVGPDTVLGSGGQPLSAGERQLLACARVLLRRPRYALLDEPTASLDPRSEEVLLEALANIKRKCGSLTIAHRVSTLRDAERVLTLRDGRLEEGIPGKRSA